LTCPGFVRHTKRIHMTPRILTINPGSTSTRASLFEGGACLLDVELAHPRAELDLFPRVMDQLEYRLEHLFLHLGEPGAQSGERLGRLDAVAGRGGFLKPMPGGVYAVSEAMLQELREAPTGEHASNLGAYLAGEFARRAGCPAFVVDPVVTDELDDVARPTGLPDISRRTIFHALGQRGAAREAAERLGIPYESGRFVAAHLGGGISVGAHRLGRVADVTNAMDGEGPFSPERSGALPLLPVLDLLDSGEHSICSLRQALTSRAGLTAHLGVSDLRQVEAMIDAGDERARAVFEAMAYNIAKHVASMLPALRGPADAIVFTGGMARSERLMRTLAGLVGWIARVEVVTGVEEMSSMCRGALLALRGVLPVRRYPPAGEDARP